MRKANQVAAARDIRASLSVVQTLVHSVCTDRPGDLERVLARVRVASLLSSSLRLSEPSSLRVCLTAWLTALDQKPSLAAYFVDKQDLGFQLTGHDGGKTGTEDSQEDLVISLVRAWAKLDIDEPPSPSATDQIFRELEAMWATDSPRRTLLKRLRRLLDKQDSSTVKARIKGHILIVSSDEVLAPVLAPSLLNMGCEVTLAADAEEARLKLDSVRFNIVLCERDLPVVDGLRFCCELRNSPATAHIPVFVILRKSGRKAVREAMEAGAEDIFPRPFDMDLIKLKIGRVFARMPTRPNSGALTGSLADIGFADMVQILAAGQKSVTISVSRRQEEGEIVLWQGEVYHAEIGRVSGKQAFYQVFSWPDGSFAVSPTAAEPVRTIEDSLMALILESSRLVDEARTEDPPVN